MKGKGESPMVTIEQAGVVRGSQGGVLDRERIIAQAGFNRWLVPPAALCIHLCIGMAYGFSVFWLPLSRALGYHTGAGAVLDDMRLARRKHGLDVHAVLRLSWWFCSGLGRLA
jgi:hypothetical protein